MLFQLDKIRIIRIYMISDIDDHQELLISQSMLLLDNKNLSPEKSLLKMRTSFSKCIYSKKSKL